MINFSLPQEHMKHMDRLNKIKPTMKMTKPPRPNHFKVNPKKELQNMCKCSSIPVALRVANTFLFLERMSEI